LLLKICAVYLLFIFYDQPLDLFARFGYDKLSAGSHGNDGIRRLLDKFDEIAVDQKFFIV
jgi:hypothetical protein